MKAKTKAKASSQALGPSLHVVHQPSKHHFRARKLAAASAGCLHLSWTHRLVWLPWGVPFRLNKMQTAPLHEI